MIQKCVQCSFIKTPFCLSRESNDDDEVKIADEYLTVPKTTRNGLISNYSQATLSDISSVEAWNSRRSASDMKIR